MLSSAANTLRALEYLVANEEAGVTEISRALGVAPGTAHRLVGTLVAEGFAEQNRENRRYRPGAKVLLLAAQLRSNVDVRDITHAHLVALADSVRETANLGTLQDDYVVYVDKVLSDQPFGIEAKVGSRLPAYCTALGKAILARVPDAQLDRYVEEMAAGTVGDSEHAPPREKAFRAELAKVARHGFAEDPGEYLPDVFCVAAAIVDGEQRPIAALSLSVPRSRFRSNRKALTQAVCDSAGQLSSALATLGIDRALV
ncbi:MAG: IclR family transcriptional regulator, regulon repressor [Solirubrobacteraceae bacterium]|jgi:DNA-binding IclR family transcriptional regulator|nr:IclR family transcriptional regulator, regulon repressor [Solirubrobacteraceae bacterium]